MAAQKKARKPKRIAMQRLAARAEWLKQGMPEDGPMSAAQKVAIVNLVSDGATLVEIETLEGMPSARTILREKHRDKEFGVALDAAQVARAAVTLDEAHHNMRVAIERDDPDTVRNAAAYVNAATQYAERTAPREYGALLKLAGHDGGQLSVAVIDYSRVPVDGGTLTDATVITDDANTGAPNTNAITNAGNSENAVSLARGNSQANGEAAPLLETEAQGRDPGTREAVSVPLERSIVQRVRPFDGRGATMATQEAQE